MSGDVQPRKRKDKKRKKDELGVEEPRGTAAVLGEGDVFMHSQHEHGTGGHWCAKIIFFSLLAVLVTLIGLIILENRGLTELEANSVESRYSGVLEGWLEEAPDDDHHNERTLELLKHHDDEDDQDLEEHEVSQEDEHDDQGDHDDVGQDEESGHDDDDEDEDDDDDGDDDHDDEDNQDFEEEDQDVSNEDEENDQQDDDDDDDEGQDQQDDDNSEEQQVDTADEDDDDDHDDDENTFGNDKSGEDEDDDDEDDLQKVDENDNAEDDDDDNFQSDQFDDQSLENDEHNKDDNESKEDEDNKNDDDEEHKEHEEEEGDAEIEVEKLEKEVSDEDALSEEQPTQEVEEEDDKSQEVSTELPLIDDGDDVDSIDDDEFLEADDIDEPLPVIERIVAPKGKPLAEVEDEPTTAKPADTLAEEEEYEKQQEELRKEQAQASHVWLKLAVGGALLVATHAVVSRAIAPRDDTPASEGHTSREDTPSMIDRRMTLIPEETAAAAASKEVVEEVAKPIAEDKIFSRASPVIKSTQPPPKEDSDEEVEEEEEVIIDTKDLPTAEPDIDKELYSDEEEPEEVDEEANVVEHKKEVLLPTAPVPEKVPELESDEPEDEEDVPDDVEIIDDEQIEEELEEEEDEEEISDVDDAELLSRLEAKYGRLPEPERLEQKHKDGGNSIEDDWPGEPSDKYWRQQLDEAEQELRQGEWSAASERVSAAPLQASVRARWVRARAIDASAEAKRDNRLLSRAINAYLDVLKLNERLSDTRLREVAERTLGRIRFRGNYLSAEPVYRLLIRRFPDVADYRNNLTVSFLMANRADLAEEVIKETLQKWPDDRVALAHLGFILKTQHNRLEEAVDAFQKALEGDIGPATESRFYYHLGDSLLLLTRFAEAHEVHKRGAKLGHFLSPAQRSLYNVERLKSQPWWDIQKTPYLKLAQALEKSWKDILKEGRAALTSYEKEKEGLKERGEWSQLDLFVRGQEVPGRCKKAPVTCSVVRSETAAAGCRRGQIKFSAMEAGTHVRPHVGPTNCRLRMHLGLSNTKDTYIRVDQETRQWQVGKVFMFDDSFEHEVWHNGTGTRLVLIVDVWHPALSPAERRELPPI